MNLNFKEKLNRLNFSKVRSWGGFGLIRKRKLEQRSMDEHLDVLARREKMLSVIMAFVFVAVAFFGYGLIKDFLFDPSKELLWGNQRIVFAFTDDNSGEDLIIRTDKKDYTGFNKSIVYFNITNKSPRDQEVESAFYFENGAQLQKLHILEDENWVDLELHTQSHVNLNNPRRKSVEGLKAENSFTHAIEEDETRYFKAEIFYPPMSKGKFFMESFGHRGAYGHLDPWYNSNWSYRKKITIESDNVVEDLVNFPLLATTTDSDLSSKARSDGYDIVFTDEAGTALNYERESYSSGTLVAWIQATISSSTDTTLYMYYGNSGSSDMATTTGVWDDNYKGVWHLGESSGSASDSTKNGFFGTFGGNLPTASTTSYIGSGQEFDGANDWITYGDVDATEFTISAWVKLNNTAGEHIFLRKGTAPDNYWFALYAGKYSVGLNHPSVWTRKDSTVSAVAGDFAYVTGRFDNTNNLLNIFVDGSKQGTGVSVVGDPNSSAIDAISGTNNDKITNDFSGVLDELRISTSVRSDGWIATEYNNQIDVSNLISYSSEQASAFWYNSSWKYRKQITIDADKVTENVVNFPLLATTTDIGLRDYARNDGYDILFTSSDGVTVLNYEREEFDGATGELISWVQTNLSSTTDTILYMYYGNNAQETDLATTTGVWDNYLFVSHMYDVTASTVLDSSTDTNFSKLSSGNPAEATGQIGNAQDHSADYIDLNDFDLNSAFSITAYVDKQTSGTQTVIGKTSTTVSATDTSYYFRIGANSGYRSSSAWEEVTVTDFTGKANVALTWDGITNLQYYKDGMSITSNTGATGAPQNVTYDSRIGTFGDYGFQKWDGIIDEIRIYNGALTSGRIKTEFNNQSDVGAFMSFAGAETEPSTIVEWYNEDWKYRKKITVDADQVAGDVTDFPLLATTTDSNFKNLVREDGYDFVFTKADGVTTLNYERERWNWNTGELITWIRTDLSSTTDTVLYMYYGNSNQTTDMASSTAVWDDNFVMVQHLEEAVNNDADGYTDSTKYLNHGQGTSMALTEVNAVIGKGADFDGGVSDRITVGADTSLDVSNNLTISAWVRRDDALLSAPDAIAVYRQASGDTQYSLYYEAAEKAEFWLYDGGWQSVTGAQQVQDTDWHHVVYTSNGSRAYIYIDGAVDKDIAFTYTPNNNAETLVLAQDQSLSGRGLNGKIDEMKISSIARSNDWIQTEYNNQKDVNTFLTFSAQEGEYSVSPAPPTDWYSTSWQYRKKITVNSGQVFSTEYDFPVMVSTTDSSLISKTRADAYDVIFTKSDGTTLLNFEAEKTSTTTGEFIYWVQTDVSSTTDTILYMYYGNPNQSTDLATTTGVWDDNYTMVWHMNSINPLDSTKNVFDGTQSGGVTNNSAGYINKDNEFLGVNEYIEGEDIDGSGYFSEITVSTWVNPDVIGAFDVIIDKSNSATSNLNQSFRLFTDGSVPENFNWKLWGESGSSPGNIVSDSSAPENIWSYVVGRYNGSEMSLWVDGVKQSAILSTNIVLNSQANNVRVGVANNIYWDGTIDEVHISDVSRSDGWIMTEYYNQRKETSNFLSFGEEENRTYKTVSGSFFNDRFTNGLIGHWTFNAEDMYNNAADISGNNYHGMLNLNAGSNTSTTTYPGKLGQALDFDGADDEVEISGLMGSPANVTLSAWIRLETYDTWGSRPVVIGDYVVMEFDETGNMDGYYLYTATPAWREINNDSSVNIVGDGDWHHAVFIVDDTNDAQYLYLDGVLRGSGSFTDSILYSGQGTNTYIGRHGNGGGNNHHDGQIDDVRIYNRALSADEVLKLSQMGRTKISTFYNDRYTNSLKGHWTFDGPYLLQNVADSSGNSNDGRLILGVSGNTSTTTMPGKLGQAYDFDGTDDYAYTDPTNQTGSWAVTFWAKADATGQGEYTGLFSSKNPSANNSFQLDIGGAASGCANQYRVRLTDSLGGGQNICMGEYKTEWQFLVTTWDSSIVRAYLNGGLQNQSGSITYDGTIDEYVIGANRNLNNFFDGKIDDLRVYNKALSQDEIEQIYRTGTIKFK